MKPGQVLTQWWQTYVAGGLRTPQSIVQAARDENPDRFEDRFTQPPVDSFKWDAPQRMAAPAFITTEAYARQQMRADWQHCDTRLQRWAAMLVTAARKRGIPLFVQCAFRTQAEQNRLNAEGFSKLRWPNGAHNIGEAVDIIHSRYAWELTQDEWLAIHHLGLECLRRLNATLKKDQQLVLNWGGDDRSKSDRFRWDPAHWEIARYGDRIRAIKAGKPVNQTAAAIMARLTPDNGSAMEDAAALFVDP